MNPGSEVWVWAECYQGALEKASLGLLGKERELAEQLGGGPVAAVLAGADSDRVVQTLFDHGADRVYLPDKAPLNIFQTDLCARFVADLAKEKGPEIMLWGATSLGSEVAARVAAKLRTGLTAHCVDLHLEEIEGVKQLVAAVAGYGGNAIIKIICPAKRPQMR